MIQDNLTSQGKFSKQKIYADLHIHTNISDGLLSPEEVIQICEGLGLSIIAITDHDAIGGIKTAKQSSKSVEVIPAVELSANIGSLDIHILAYFIDYNNGELVDYLTDFCRHRMTRIFKMSEKLAKAGIRLDLDEIVKMAGSEALGRPHIARALLKYGHVHSIKEAFIKYLGCHCPYYVPKKEIHPERLIQMIKKWQGIPVIAHPGILNDENLIQQLINYGAKGIEVWHPEHNSSQERRFYEIAERNNLLMTGGSDYHGFPGTYNQLGQPGCGEKEIAAIREYQINQLE